MSSQALILGAGLSTRMRPLTQDIPKILLPFLHQRLIDFQRTFLGHHGYDRLAINVHHGRDALLRVLKEDKFASITPFVEAPEILGSGGGIFNMQSFVSDDTVLVMNSDALCDVDISAALSFHQKHKMLATLILVGADTQKYGSVGVDEGGRVCRLRTYQGATSEHTCGVFSGVQILSRELFSTPVPRGPFDLIQDCYIPLIQKGARIGAVVDPSFWIDVGELPYFLSAQFNFLGHLPRWAQPLMSEFDIPQPGIWVHRSVELKQEDLTLHAPVFIGPGCQLSKHTVLGPHAILAGSNHVGSHSSLSHVMLYPGLRVPPNSQLLSCVLTPETAVDLPSA